MDSITTWLQGFTSFQIVLLVEFGLVVWAIFSKGQMREFVISFICFGVLAGLYFYPRVEAATDFEQILGIVAFLAGVFFLDNAGRYHERVIEGYDQAIEEAGREYALTVANNDVYKVKTKTHYLPERVSKEIEREHIELDTDILLAQKGQESLEISRREQQAWGGLVDKGKEQGLITADVAAINKEREMGRVQTEQKYEETIAVIKAGDILKTSDVQVDKQLRKELLQALRERQAIIDGDDAPLVKEEAIAAWDASIARIKRQLNEQGNGLVLSSDGQEDLRFGEGTADVRGLEEQGDERPPEQVPAPRRRGRPAGSGSAKRGGKGKSSSHTGNDGGGQK